MNYRKIFWGVILIFLGTLFILKNFGVIYFQWFAVFRLWPLLLVLWGISLIPVKSSVKLLCALATIAVGVLILAQMDHRYLGLRSFSPPFFHHYYWDDDAEKDDSRNYDFDDDIDYKYDKDVSQTFSEPFESNIKEAELHLDAVAGDFKLAEWTNELIEFEKTGSLGRYSMTSKDIDDKRIIHLNLRKSNVRFKNRGDNVDIKLNRMPVWDLDLDIGAAKFDLDLSEFKIHDIIIDGGAAAITLKLGDRHYETNVDIDTGASSITIKIPEKSGCEVKTSTVLSSKTLNGFEKKNKQVYRTENFEVSENKIYISIDAAVSSLNVRRY
ncbi:MAG: hypothetical protein KAT48_01840 [Bacteroidales bacterium]|nr:hypothetical protein [Bacteroidales bacterium]